MAGTVGVVVRPAGWSAECRFRGLSSPMRRQWGIALVVVVVLSIVGFAQTSAGHVVLRRAGLAAPPPSYVALSFASPDQMLTHLFSPEALLDPAFVVTNKSGATQHFDWTMIEIQHGHSRRIAVGSAVVPADGRAAFDHEVLTSCVGGTLTIEIRLAYPREAIRWVTACVPRGF